MLVQRNVDMVEVVENDRLVGVLSVRDIMTRVGIDYAAKLARPVREFMTTHVESLPPDAPITFGINKMDVGGYRHVPIVQDGRVLGVASAKDVIRYLLKSQPRRCRVRSRASRPLLTKSRRRHSWREAVASNWMAGSQL